MPYKTVSLLKTLQAFNCNSFEKQHLLNTQSDDFFFCHNSLLYINGEAVSLVCFKNTIFGLVGKLC